MSTAFGHSDSDNPFDASHEEYIRSVEADAATLAPAFDGNQGEIDEPDDDPEVTQASAKTADFSSAGVGDGVEASWSNLAETTEGDPFVTPSEEPSPTRDQA